MFSRGKFLRSLYRGSTVLPNLFSPTDLVLRIIREELESVKNKRYLIGIQLGIPHHKLKEFDNELDPLAAGVNYWLNGNAESTIPISWTSIVAALKTNSVGESGLAKNIGKKYCPCALQEAIDEAEKGMTI